MMRNVKSAGGIHSNVGSLSCTVTAVLIFRPLWLNYGCHQIQMDDQNCFNEDGTKLIMQTSKPQKHMESDDNDAKAFEGRFKATKMWNGVMKRFRSGMPLKRHRKLMFSYDNSFTGREAVDFLMNELPKFYSAEKRITRSNCHMLLKKFIDAGLFLSVRAKENDIEEIFRENEVYRFSDVPLEKVAATPILVRRASSFNERPSFGSTPCSRDYSKTSVCKKADNLRTLDQNVFDPLPAVRSPLVKSRRLSSSHGNLPSMVSPKICSTVMITPAHLKLRHNAHDVNNGGDAVVNEADKLLPSKNSIVASEENLSCLDEVISQLQKVGEKPINVNTSLTIRSFGKVLQSSSDDLSPSLPEHRTIFYGEMRSRLSPVRVKRTFDEKEINGYWKQAFCNRLKKLLRSDSLDGIIEGDFSGADLKWNCEKIGFKGIVKARDENGDLSTYLIAMMRYLTRWPFDQKFVEKVAVYPGIERNVFENVCEHFAKGRPILSHSTAKSIIAIVNFFKMRSNSCSRKTSDDAVRVETEFSIHDSPVTRFVALLQNGIESDNKNVDEGLRDCSSSVPCSFSNYYCELKNSDKAGYDKSSLQGSSSQCKMKTVLSSQDHLSSKATNLKHSPLVSSISQEDGNDLLESVALILLTLPPLTRRRLHYLVRFMEKICKNHCLRLSLSYENRHVVLERLTGSVLSPTTSISATQCSHIVSFLIDNQNEVFSVPESFKAEVENLLHHCNSKANSHGNQCEESVLNEIPKQYCEPIKTNEYDQQKEFGMEMHLLNLLDSIVSNETITLEERKRQLRKFKRTYPEIYSKRFATPKAKKPRTPSFLNRLRTFNFRQ